MAGMLVHGVRAIGKVGVSMGWRGGSKGGGFGLKMDVNIALSSGLQTGKCRVDGRGGLGVIGIQTVEKGVQEDGIVLLRLFLSNKSHLWL